jgi:hypothetical protein
MDLMSINLSLVIFEFMLVRVSVSKANEERLLETFRTIPAFSSVFTSLKTGTGASGLNLSHVP